RDNAELEQQQLHVLGELLAVGRIGDLDRPARQQRGRAVASEERLQENALEGLRPTPDALRDDTLLAECVAEICKATPRKRGVTGNVEPPDLASTDDRVPHTAAAANNGIEGINDVRKEIEVRVVEARPALTKPAFRDPCSEEKSRLALTRIE